MFWLHSLTAEASISATPRRRLAQVVNTGDLGSSICTRLLSKGSHEARTLTKARLAARRSDK